MTMMMNWEGDCVNREMKGRLKDSICMRCVRAVYWHTISNSGSETSSSPD
jgi:hypothetical protein